VDSPEPLELAPDEPSSPSYVPDEPLPLDPPPVLPPFELLDNEDGSSVPGPPGAAVAQCARATPRPRQRMTPDRWVDFFMVMSCKRTESPMSGDRARLLPGRRH